MVYRKELKCGKAKSFGSQAMKKRLNLNCLIRRQQGLVDVIQYFRWSLRLQIKANRTHSSNAKNVTRGSDVNAPSRVLWAFKGPRFARSRTYK